MALTLSQNAFASIFKLSSCAFAFLDLCFKQKWQHILSGFFPLIPFQLYHNTYLCLKLHNVAGNNSQNVPGGTVMDTLWHIMKVGRDDKNLLIRQVDLLISRFEGILKHILIVFNEEKNAFWVKEIL